MAATTQKIIRNLQRRIETQSDFEKSQAKYQADMHRSYFEMCDLNSKLIGENAELRRSNFKLNQ